MKGIRYEEGNGKTVIFMFRSGRLSLARRWDNWLSSIILYITSKHSGRDGISLQFKLRMI